MKNGKAKMSDIKKPPIKSRTAPDRAENGKAKMSDIKKPPIKSKAAHESAENGSEACFRKKIVYKVQKTLAIGADKIHNYSVVCLTMLY